MTDGLEISEKSISFVNAATEILRLEAEFFNAAVLHTAKTVKGADIVDLIQYGTSEELNDDKNGYPILRLNEFDNAFIKEPARYCDKITEQEYIELQLKQDDVLICRTNGNPDLVGRSSVVMENVQYAFASYLFRVRTNALILPHVLVAYLRSKYGRAEIDKYSMKGNQTNFSPAKFREIDVPVFAQSFQEKIKKAFIDAYSLHISAKKLYAQAEATLNTYLNIREYDDSGSAVKALSQSFKQSGRLDAEYYQSKYNSLITQINTTEIVSSLCNVFNENFVPDDKVEYKYIELANVGVSGDISNVETIIGIDLPSRARRLVRKGQVIISSIEGSLSSCALIDDEYDGALCSTGFYVVNSDKINSETLLVLFKSEPIQALLKQRCSGTILTAISKDEFVNMPLPSIDYTVQKEIADKVQESFRLRKEAKWLLDNAIKAVEMAIETDEETANGWLSTNGVI